MAQMIIGIKPRDGFITVGDRDEFPGQWRVGIGGDNPSGFSQGMETVEMVVGFSNTGPVGIGLVQLQPCSLVIDPGGGVPVGAAGRVSGNVTFICPESGQGDHTVSFIVGEAGRLDGRAELGCLSAADVIGIANRSSQGIGDAGRMVRAGQVAGGGDVAGRIRGFDWSSGSIRFGGGHIAPGIGLVQNHACGGIGASL